MMPGILFIGGLVSVVATLFILLFLDERRIARDTREHYAAEEFERRRARALYDRATGVSRYDP